MDLVVVQQQRQQHHIDSDDCVLVRGVWPGEERARYQKMRNYYCALYFHRGFTLVQVPARAVSTSSNSIMAPASTPKIQLSLQTSGTSSRSGRRTRKERRRNREAETAESDEQLRWIEMSWENLDSTGRKGGRFDRRQGRYRKATSLGAKESSSEKATCSKGPDAATG